MYIQNKFIRCTGLCESQFPVTQTITCTQAPDIQRLSLVSLPNDNCVTARLIDT